MGTLKNLYETHQKAQITEKVNRKTKVLIEAQRIYENKEIRVLLEALDESKLSELSSTLQKLVQLISPIRNDVTSLSGALERAQKELEGQMAGGAKEWVKSKLGMAAAAKAMALVGALKQGFSQMPKIAKFVTASGQNIDKTKPLSDLLQGSSIGNAKSILKKSLTPPGFLASLKNIVGGSGLPYIQNIDVLVQELMGLPFEKLERFSSDMSQVSLPVSSQDAKQVVDTAKQGGQEQTSGQHGSSAESPQAGNNQSAAPNNSAGNKQSGGKTTSSSEIAQAIIKNKGKFMELIGGTELRDTTLKKIAVAMADSLKSSMPDRFKD